MDAPSSDVSHLEHHVFHELAFDVQVPLLDVSGGIVEVGGAGTATDLGVTNARKNNGRRTLGKIHDRSRPQRRSEGLAAVDSGHRIVGQFGIVLVGLHIVKNAVAAAHRGFIVRAGRVRKTDARREVLPVGRHIAGATGAGGNSGCDKQASLEVEVGEAIVLLDHRCVYVIPYPKVERELGRNTVVVHQIGAELPPAHAVSPSLCVAEKTLRVTDEKVGQGNGIGVGIGTGELSRVEQISARILNLKETVQSAPQVASHLEGMTTVDVGEGIQQLIIIFVQDFGEPVAVAQTVQAADLDVGQAAREGVTRIIDSGNPQLGRKLLSFEEGLRSDLVSGVADLQFVDLTGGKRMHIAEPRHQRFVVDVAGE